MAAEGEFPKVDGDVLYGSEINSFGGKIQQVYTGTGFDSTTATADPDEQSHELDAVATVNGAGFVKVKITGTSTLVTGGETALGTVKLKAQIKETGQSYGDIVVYKTVFGSTTFSTGRNITTSFTYEIVATLTVGMKTNGFQIKVFSTSDKLNPASTVTFTNIQTVQELA